MCEPCVNRRLIDRLEALHRDADRVTWLRCLHLLERHLSSTIKVQPSPEVRPEGPQEFEFPDQ